MKRAEKRLGDILIGQGVLTRERLEQALAEQARTNAYLGEILVRRGYITGDQLLMGLSEQFAMPLVCVKSTYIDWEFVKMFSASLVIDYHCLPLGGDDSSVTIAMTNPLDVWAIKRAEEEAGGLKVKFVLISEEDLKEAVERYKQYLRGSIGG